MSWWGRRRAGYTRVLELSLFGLLPVLLLGFLVVRGLADDQLALDFTRAFLPAADAIGRGSSPYPGLDDPQLLAGLAYVYPPLTAILVLPFSILPVTLAQVLVTVLLAACVVATLRVLDVEDWRCYGLAFVWPPVFSALQTANITIALGLCAALAWRWRNVPTRAGSIVGVSLAAKVFLWPLLVWLAVTRRLGSLVTATVVASVVTVVTWGALGLVGLEDYPALLRKLGDIEAPLSYSVYALGLDLDLPSGLSRGVWLALAVALLAAVVMRARSGDERGSFVLAIAASLAFSPIVWMHYFALLLVPVAATSRRLGPAWLCPLLLWVGTGTFNGDPWQTAVVLLSVALTLGCCLGSGPRVEGEDETLAPAAEWPLQGFRDRRSASADRRSAG